MKKKAAIELSVTAIVILILAIVILGLGLGFIRGMFSKASMQFEQQIATEPEPPTMSASDPLTLSRESIITNAGSTEVLKIGVYNPTSRDWAQDEALGCGNFTTENVCETQEGCSWQADACTGTATACDNTILKNDESKCKDQKGCMWDLATSACTNAMGATPDLTCAGMTQDPDAEVNRKIIRQGESAVFNYLMTIPKGITEKTYLCEVQVKDYQKDLIIKVAK